jgi:phenylacetic acid degradation operon negative regulatory protein
VGQADPATAEIDDNAENAPQANTGSARSLLLTVLAELVAPQSDKVWTASLLYILLRLEVEERTARRSIARAAESGWIRPQRDGREVAWELTPEGRQLIRSGARRIDSVRKTSSWDGSWLIVLVTVPHMQRAVRRKLHAALSWEGFGNPQPGVWVSPHLNRQEGAWQIINSLGLRDSTLAFAGAALPLGLREDEIVARAWDLDAVRAEYEQLILRYSGLRPGPGDPTLLTHIQMANEWQRIPFLDPQLPDALLPDWIGRRAAVVFAELQAKWQAPARDRWREIAKETSAG